ncbi:G5 domain-containing protein, partial [Pseudoglutamicibacter cumminsii]|uniref:G5 domain-containing protein n=1 Tax=Pseudoglutamicibacter cumminsii TaxID=156979 RepID=UPI0026ECDB29
MTSTQKIKDGKLDGDPEVTTERTKEPTKRIIRVGTYDPAPSVEPKQVELPYTTKIVYDKNLEPGQEVVDQEGENGLIEVTVKDGQPEVKTVKEPVERIVRVGTKPAEGVEWTEEIAFEVKVVEDPELEAGKVETVQQGKPGERVHKTDGTEEVRVKPVDHIIKVGTKCNCDQPTPDPSEDPTPEPSEEPTPEPSEEPTPEPSEDPTPDPSEDPTPEPSEDPTPDPSEEPTPEPSEDPTPDPSE